MIKIRIFNISIVILVVILFLCIVCYLCLRCRKTNNRKLQKMDLQKMKDQIGHLQQWRCKQCSGIMLSNFELIVYQGDMTYAMCVNCAPNFRIIIEDV